MEKDKHLLSKRIERAKRQGESKESENADKIIAKHDNERDNSKKDK